MAVTSNTSQPSSAAQITRESSRKRSDSLEEENGGLHAQLQKIGRAMGQSVNLSDQNAERSNGVERGSQGSVTK